jgi:phosphoribosylformylglycinamidine synthase
MKFGVVTFPGSNCDEDMVYVIKNHLGQEVERLWHKDTDLKGVDFVVLPGGFSYGDYLRSGAIARFSPIMSEVISHANKGGYVLGVCNGFQILCESGLVEGALLHNLSQTFICRNVFIKPGSGSAPINENLDSRAFKIPIAHGEGRFYASNDTLQSIVEHEQIIFQYCDKDGQVNDESNPNGSLMNIAGITNRKKNVFGMMPHPERAADRVLSNLDGRLIFDSLLRFC